MNQRVDYTPQKKYIPISFLLFLILFSVNSFAQAPTWVAQNTPALAGGLDTATLPTSSLPPRLSSPFLVDLDNDGDKDFVSGGRYGELYYFENIGNATTPSWVITPLLTIDTIDIAPNQVINEVKPTLEDFDNDGDFDLFVTSRWDSTGTFKLDDIRYFENIGTATNPFFESHDLTPYNLKFQQLAEFGALAFVDIDGDGDKDIVSLGSDSLAFLRNDGTNAAPFYTRVYGVANPFNNISTVVTNLLFTRPNFEDFDNDGDYDLIAGTDQGMIIMYENKGTAMVPDFLTSAQVPFFDSLGLDDLGNFVSPHFADVTGDGIKDAIIGTFAGANSVNGQMYWYKGVVDCDSTSTTTSNISPIVCNSYTAPSGMIYTISGIYNDTIANVAGCDSVIMINLTVNNSTSSSINPIVCNSYTSPNGTIYTSSAMFNDTLTNAVGCDSIITVNLTVNNSTSSSINPIACDRYTSPAGMVYTSSTMFNDTLTNAVGCDSIITVNLTINNSTSSSINPVVCDRYTSPSGTLYTSSITFNDTLTNAVGCDSIITVNLTVNNSTSSSISPIVCGNYTSPNGTLYTSSTMFNDTLTNAVGCDSIITINLTVNNSTSSSINPIACDYYTSPAGTVYTSSTTFNDTLTNAVGCDSIITVNLTINNSTSSSLNPVVCNSYTSPSGTLYTSSTNFVDTITNAVGCDSIITINLTVNNVDTSITVSGITLTANVTGASYQWIDCNNNSPIIGDTNQIFMATMNGDYAVIITENGCTDTSSCYSITPVGVQQLEMPNFVVYPNPTESHLTLDLGEYYNGVEIEMFNSIGQIILRNTYEYVHQISLNIHGVRGVYWLSVTTNEGLQQMIKVVKE